MATHPTPLPIRSEMPALPASLGSCGTATPGCAPVISTWEFRELPRRRATRAGTTDACLTRHLRRLHPGWSYGTERSRPLLLSLSLLRVLCVPEALTGRKGRPADVRNLSSSSSGGHEALAAHRKASLATSDKVFAHVAKKLDILW